MNGFKISKAAILGMGISGQAVSQFFKKKGIEHFGVDKAKTDLGEVSILPEEKICLEGVDLVVKSPGVPFEHPWVRKAEEMQIPLVGEIDLALSEIKNKEVIAVTGSNGKTTTTLFLSHLLNTVGKKALAVGNVGCPLISVLDSNYDVFVLELSSFQLEKIWAVPVFDAAIILNITPNHLDRHASFSEYAAAKFRVSNCLKEKGFLIVSQEIKERFGVDGKIFDSYRKKIETIFPSDCRKEKKFYQHDLENFSAAFAAVEPSDEMFFKALNTFQKPPHRIEFIREVNGVSFINDSKATSVDAVMKAVNCLNGPLVLLAGGVDKGGTYSEWIPVFKEKVLKVFAFGKAADKMVKELSKDILIEKVATLEHAVEQAFTFVSSGDTVLLSPGCASYDQFKDYQQRGDRFKEIVLSLK